MTDPGAEAPLVLPEWPWFSRSLQDYQYFLPTPFNHIKNGELGTKTGWSREESRKLLKGAGLARSRQGSRREKGRCGKG